MTDRTERLDAPGLGRLSVLRAASRSALGPLAPANAWRAVAVLALAHVLYYARHEGWLTNVVFTAGVTTALAAALTLLTRRALFAATLVSAIVALVVIASDVKRRAMDMVVHAYDLVFYFGSWSTIAFLWSEYRGYMIALAAALVITVAISALAWRLDGTRVARSASALLLAFAIAATATGAALKGNRPHTLFYWTDLYVSSFYASWSETLETLWRGQLVEAAPSAEGPPFALTSECASDAKPPHIILIHEESVVQPSLFRTLKYDRRLDSLFKSFDGRTHRLGVETYGGASWLTEFSILAGVSTHSFGGMRPFVQAVMQGKLRDTLPEALARCGYRNVVFYPMLRNFVSNARFYASIGLNEVFDLKDQGAKTVNERDRFYFANAMAEMERHLTSSSKPLFTFIQTMSAHAPYDVRYEPELQVPGGGPGTPAEMHEYLRRLWLSRLDYEELKSELKRRFPAERFLIMHYGDHHPSATRTLLGIGQALEVEDIELKKGSLGFTTYYAVEGINFRPPALPPYPTLDVPYLGSLLLRSAGLPLSDSHKERLRLLDVCAGRYDGCLRRQEILRFHRRLIDSGLMAAR